MENEKSREENKNVEEESNRQQIEPKSDEDETETENEDENASNAYEENADIKKADIKSADRKSANDKSANVKSADVKNADVKSADVKSAKPPVRAGPVDDEPLLHVEFKTLVRFFKASFLFIVWLIILLTLMRQPIHERRPRIFTVQPNEMKLLRTPEPVVGRILAITLLGPFLSANEFYTHINESAPQLRVQLQRTFLDHHNLPLITVNVSSVWIEYIEGSRLPEEAKPLEKDYVFKVFRNVSQDLFTRNQLVFWTNVESPVTLKVLFDRPPPEKSLGLLWGGLTLALLYVLIIWDLMHRTVAAMFCSTLALGVLGSLNPRPSMDTIIRWIDAETLLLLFSLMILVAIMTQAGAFDFFALQTYKLSRGDTWILINSLGFTIAVVSAFLDNVTIMLLVSPVIVKLCEALMLDPQAVLYFMLIYANIGGAATPIGSPANLVIASNPLMRRLDIDFAYFSLHTAPCTLIVLIQTYYQLRHKYRSLADLQAFHDVEKLRQENRRRIRRMWKRAVKAITEGRTDRIEHDVFLAVMRRIRFDEKGNVKPLTYEETLEVLNEHHTTYDNKLLIKTAVSVGLVIVLYFVHSVTADTIDHMSLGWTVLISAILLLILADLEDLPGLFARVDWSTLIFFGSLFILIQIVALLGILEMWGKFLVTILVFMWPKLRLTAALMLIYWVAAIFSALLNNVPLTSMMLRIVIAIAHHEELELPLEPLIWALALGANFGGNGTLLASAANVVTVGVAERNSFKLNFVRFLKIGFPIMLGNGVVASIYLIVCHVYYEWNENPSLGSVNEDDYMYYYVYDD